MGRQKTERKRKDTQKNPKDLMKYVRRWERTESEDFLATVSRQQQVCNGVL